MVALTTTSTSASVAAITRTRANFENGESRNRLAQVCRAKRASSVIEPEAGSSPTWPIATTISLTEPIARQSIGWAERAQSWPSSSGMRRLPAVPLISMEASTRPGWAEPARLTAISMRSRWSASSPGGNALDQSPAAVPFGKV